MTYTNERVQYLEQQVEARDATIAGLRDFIAVMKREYDLLKAIVDAKVKLEERKSNPVFEVRFRAPSGVWQAHSGLVNAEIAQEVARQAGFVVDGRNPHPEALETTAIEANGPEIDGLEGPGEA